MDNDTSSGSGDIKPKSIWINHTADLFGQKNVIPNTNRPISNDIIFSVTHLTFYLFLIFIVGQ
jgi:hypothetical protein